jgi:NAD(P)H-hydrate epimerase
MADTLISDGNDIFINTSGNPGLSTGGSGDVLSGIIASFIAQGKTVLQAATFGVFLHGFSADLAVKEFGENALLPSDVINYLAKAIESFKIMAQ